MEGFALGLALKQRWNATQKSPICLLAQESVFNCLACIATWGGGGGGRKGTPTTRIHIIGYCPLPHPLCATAQAIKCLVQYIQYICDHNCPKIHHESIEAVTLFLWYTVNFHTCTSLEQLHFINSKFLPSEKESQQRPSKIQPFVTIVITII